MCIFIYLLADLSLYAHSELIVQPWSVVVRPSYSKIFSKPLGLSKLNFIWSLSGLVCSIGDSGPIIVCSNDDPRLTLTYFTARSNLVPYAFIWGKTVRKSFNGRNLQQITRVTNGLSKNKNSDPRGLSAPALGLYTCIKTGKNMYKIRLQRYVFETCNK